MMEDRFSVLLFRTCLVGCLLGSVGTIYFLLGLAGYVGSSLLNLFVAASLVAATVFFLAAFIGALWETNWVGRILWLSIFVILGTEIILCLVPPTARDELTHHLAIPQLYVRAGKIIEVPMAPYSYFPMLLDMLYTPWVYWGYDSVSKFIHGLFAFLTGLSLYAYLSRRMNAVYGLVGFFFHLSAVGASLESLGLRRSRYNLLLYGSAFVHSSLARRQDRRAMADHGCFICRIRGSHEAQWVSGMVAIIFLFAWVAVRETEQGLGKILSNCVLFAAVGALPFLPWLAKNWLQTGNPFSPAGWVFPCED